jgi:transcription-repair coupling factor (superfamily II helicase)
MAARQGKAAAVTAVFGAPEGWDAVLLARRSAEHAGPLLHACRDDARMARLAESLAFFVPTTEVLCFPAWDCLPYDRVSPNPALVSERIATLARLLEKPAAARIVLTTVNALVQRVPPRHVFRGASLALAEAGTVDPVALVRFLDANGYGHAGTVMEPGEYAVRGGIIDIFPAGHRDPVRLDMFGDTIESIRAFDPASQRSGVRLSRVALRPVSEVFLDKDSVARFRVGWRELFGAGAAEDPLYLSVSEGRRHPGMEHWVPLFHQGMETLLDYVPGASCSLDHQAMDVLASRLEMIADHYDARRAVPREGEVPYRPLPPDRLYLDHAGWDAMLGGGPLFGFGPFGRPDGAIGVDGGGRPGPVFAQAGAGPGAGVFDQLRAQAGRWTGEGRRLAVAAWTRGSRDRLVHLLHEHGFRAEAADDWQAAGQMPDGVAAVVVLGLERGFVADDRDFGKWAFVSEQDLLGERISHPPRRRKRADQFIAEATEIAEGDLVVHQDHGIGRYDGLVTLTVSDAAHDCLRLLYDGDDKLFLPVENIEMLSRFGSDAGGVALDKLGGASWQNRKARAKQRIRDMAGALIRVAAERKLRDAEVMAPAEGSWDEFCARFPHA